jgi:hypothetical protein
MNITHLCDDILGLIRAEVFLSQTERTARANWDELNTELVEDRGYGGMIDILHTHEGIRNLTPQEQLAENIAKQECIQEYIAEMRERIRLQVWMDNNIQ